MKAATISFVLFVLVAGSKALFIQKQAAKEKQAPVIPDQGSDLPARKRVGASIAVHPPKFSLMGKFLEQWYLCAAARHALYPVLVFSDEADHMAFTAGMAALHPLVLAGSWGAAVAPIPDRVSLTNNGQVIAAFKKWFGVTHLMDMGDAAPEYVLMLDAELLLYNKTNCGPESDWYHLHDRLRVRETSKLWPAAKVGTMKNYAFSPTDVKTGRDYDRILINQNANWISALPSQRQCTGLPTAGCKEIKRQIDDCLFSWWTDLPYMNTAIVKKMLLSDDVSANVYALTPSEAAITGKLKFWGARAQKMTFPVFEHMAYQQWCIMHEGYRWHDVTDVTGESKWGSYLEDPLPGARIKDLHPLWLSADAYMAVKNGEIPEMSNVDPPLLIFHVDHSTSIKNGRSFFPIEFNMARWQKFLDRRINR